MVKTQYKHLLNRTIRRITLIDLQDYCNLFPENVPMAFSVLLFQTIMVIPLVSQIIIADKTRDLKSLLYPIAQYIG